MFWYELDYRLAVCRATGGAHIGSLGNRSWKRVLVLDGLSTRRVAGGAHIENLCNRS